MEQRGFCCPFLSLFFWSLYILNTTIQSHHSFYYILSKKNAIHSLCMFLSHWYVKHKNIFIFNFKDGFATFTKTFFCFKDGNATFTKKNNQFQRWYCNSIIFSVSKMFLPHLHFFRNGSHATSSIEP